MADEAKMNTYVIHNGEWHEVPSEHVVQAAGYEFVNRVHSGDTPVVVFKDAEGATVGAFAQWVYFEREGGVAKREVKKDTKPEAPKHR